MLYLDHAATTPMRPSARAAMEPFLADGYGNPSGVHGVSRAAKNAVEEARERAAHLLGAARPLDIVFTGGGTEADNLALAGAALAGGGRGGVVTSAVEHEAVLETARFLERLGCPVTVVGVDPSGRVDPAGVAVAVDAATAVVSVMAANNETGVVEPVAEVAAAVAATGHRPAVHTDAVQAFISRDVTAASTGADLISLASHKLGGPKGVGLLYVRDGIALEPVLHGGGQELGRRSGTLNVAGIVGMVAAMEESAVERTGFTSRVGAARDGFEAALAAALPGVGFTGKDVERLVQHSHVRIPGIDAETLLIRLDQEGIAASAGSACHSGAVLVSHVLAAMGFDAAVARECVRFTFGWVSQPGDGPTAAATVARVVELLR